MKTIIGIDSQSEYKPVVHLYKNLKFRASETVLIHAADTVLPYLPSDWSIGAEAHAAYVKSIDSAGRDALAEAQSFAASLDLDTTTRLQYGGSSQVLLQQADEMGADLVAVCATHTGSWSASFFGSVSRSLAVGSKASTLVAKGHIESPKALKVVLATDHSDYSKRWIEKFLHMRATGITEINVVSAFEMNEYEARALEMNMPDVAGDISEYVEQKMRDKSDELVKLLTQWGYTATAQIMHGSANDVIRQAMQDTSADLLVMGAQGHGFLERLLIGSVALRQVTAEPYPVLIVRP